MTEINDKAKELITKTFREALDPAVNEVIKRVEEKLDEEVNEVRIKMIETLTENLSEITQQGEKTRTELEELKGRIKEFKAAYEEQLRRTSPPFSWWYWTVVGILSLSTILNIVLLALYFAR